MHGALPAQGKTCIPTVRLLVRALTALHSKYPQEKQFCNDLSRHDEAVRLW